MKKEVFKIATIFLITVGVVLWGLNFIFFGQAPKSKATGETMNLSFTPATATVAANADFTVTILAKPSINTVLRGYKTKVNFDKAILKLKSIQYKVGVVSTDLGNTTADIASVNSSGIVYIVGEDTTAVGNTLTAANGAELVSLTFKALAATGTTVTMTDSSFYSVNSDGSLFDTWTIAAQNLGVNGGGSIGSCTSFSDDFSGTTLNANNWNLWTNNTGTAGFTTPAGEVTLFLPASAVTVGTTLDSFDKHNIDGGGDFTAELVLKSASTLDGKQNAISMLAIGARSNDSRQIRIDRHTQDGNICAVFDNVAGNTGEVAECKDIGLTNNTPVKVKIARIGGVVKTYYDKLDGQGYQLLKQFDGSYTEPSRVYFGIFNGTPDFPQVSATFDDFKLTCASAPTPTGGATGNVKLNLKLKFQGINKLPATGENSMVVKVKVDKDGAVAPVDGTGTFVSDSNGIWTGTVGVNLTDVALKYKILVKGPQHIQKKVCDSTPSETSPGIYRCSDGNITLIAGDNNLDFSGIILLVGDLDQNGIVDSVDFGLVRNCLGKSDSVCVSSSDLNLDGRVDTQDFSLIIAALGVRTDEQ